MDTSPIGLAGRADLARIRADKSSPDALPQAARHFESLFVQMMLKSMREASSVFGESDGGTYRDMFDQQIAVEMTKGRGLGIATMLAAQLRDAGGSAE